MKLYISKSNKPKSQSMCIFFCVSIYYITPKSWQCELRNKSFWIFDDMHIHWVLSNICCHLKSVITINRRKTIIWHCNDLNFPLIWYFIHCSVGANPVNMTCTDIDTLRYTSLCYITFCFLIITVSVQVLENGLGNTIIRMVWPCCNYEKL